MVIIMVDDAGWWDFGANGNPHIETPHIDRLAAEGVNFTNFHAQPVCAPTRASLMTGRHYLRTGVYNTRFGGDTMRASEVTLPSILRNHGYRTVLAGKWHLGAYAPYAPHNRGFEESLSQAHGHLERYWHPDQFRRNGRSVETRGHITDVLTDAAINAVRRRDPRPFFLFLSYNVPHSPHYISDEYVQRYLAKGLPLTQAQIYGQITHCDRGVGRLLAALDKEKLRDNTIVMFLSDNGGVSTFFNGGLRGRKASAFEGGTRVPFFARWPGRFPAGARVPAMACVQDILPTVCELTGAPLPHGVSLDGESIAGLMRRGRGDSPHDYLYAIWDRFQPRIDRSQWSIRGRRYKLVREQLFDLDTDPGERVDIAAVRPDIAREMRERFAAWLEEVTSGQTFEPPPIPVGHPDENPVEIQASWARIHGSHVTWASASVDPGKEERLGDPAAGSAVNYTFAGYDWDTIDGWKNPGETATWKLDVWSAGVYDVTVSYGCDPETAGGMFRISASGNAVEAEVRATPSRNVFETRPAGALRLAKGAATLEVSVVGPGRGQELMTLNRIWLRKR